MTQSLDSLLAEVTELTGRAVNPAPVSQVPTVAVVGSAEQDRIRVDFEGGKVTGITLDPRVMRKSNAELAEQLCLAVNNAIDAHNTELMAVLQDRRTDFGALQHRLGEIREEAGHSMQAYLRQLDEVLRRASQRG